MQKILNLLEQQDAFFKTNETLSVAFRKKSLQRLKKVILKSEDKILDALYKDLRKPRFEAYTSEIAVVLTELDYFIKNIDKLAKPRRVNTSLLNFPSADYIYNDPYGRVLIMAPWNYPFQLVINPLIAAISAGNCVVCKPSERTEHTSALLSAIISEVFDSKHVCVIEGGIEENQFLLKQKWDYIFFTGSSTVGKIVMKAAAEQLCPVTLELGGKSPVIVNADAKLQLAAKRIVWGKLFNAGQTCIAPDYIYVHESVKSKLVDYLIEEIHLALGENIEQNTDFARIVNKKHFSRILHLLEKEKVAFGGNYNEEERYIQPTLLTDVTWESKIMQEEIFGPLLPILSFSSLKEVIHTINSSDKPLAAYYFGEQKVQQDVFLKELYFGGGCINDTLIHITSKQLPFGGVGTSGIGSYHGFKSFECFSHQKGIVKRGTWLDIPVRYAPYDSKLPLIKKLFKLLS
jgi:aldehyde dehydrogenase (NAD+)